MFCTRILLVIILLFLSSTDKQKGAEADGLLIDDESHGLGMDMVIICKIFGGVNKGSYLLPSKIVHCIELPCYLTERKSLLILGHLHSCCSHMPTVN